MTTPVSADEPAPLTQTIPAGQDNVKLMVAALCSLPMPQSTPSSLPQQAFPFPVKAAVVPAFLVTHAFLI